jgi:hypothetical protein
MLECHMKRIAALLVIFASTSFADFIANSQLSGGPGSFGYSYSFQNTGSDPIFEISFTGSGLITNVVEPAGWVDSVIPFGADTAITWISTDTPFDIGMGTTLAGFGLTSSDGAGTVTFNALTESFASESANSVGPVVDTKSTPEPRSAALLASSLLLLFALRRASAK